MNCILLVQTEPLNSIMDVFLQQLFGLANDADTVCCFVFIKFTFDIVLSADLFEVLAFHFSVFSILRHLVHELNFVSKIFQEVQKQLCRSLTLLLDSHLDKLASQLGNIVEFMLLRTQVPRIAFICSLPSFSFRS